MRLIIAVTIFSLTFIAQASLASEKIAELQQRLHDLEMQQKEIEDWYTNFYLLGKDRVGSFLDNKIFLGGYFETSISNISGPDMQTQTSSNNQALGISVTAELNENIRLVTQTLTAGGIPLRNQHNNPNLTPSHREYSGYVFGSLLAQGYLEYRPGNFFNLQAGLGYIPFGIAYQQREPVLFKKRGGPQMLLNDDGTGVGISSALWMGLHIYGFLPFEKKSMGYNLYTVPPASKVNMIGAGGRLWWAVSENLKTGVSFQYGEKVQSSYLSQGVDIDFKHSNYGFLSEYAVVDYSGNDLSAKSYYFEPYYKLFEGRWVVFVNIEYIKLPTRVDAATQTPEPIEKRFYGAGVNWLPLPTTRLRLNYLKHDYIKETDSIDGQKRDYAQVELSMAVAF